MAKNILLSCEREMTTTVYTVSLLGDFLSMCTTFLILHNAKIRVHFDVKQKH